MRVARIVVAIIAFLALCYGTVLVFQIIDRNSHSVSDTLRPFIITMGPVWLVFILAALFWLRPDEAPREE